MASDVILETRWLLIAPLMMVLTFRRGIVGELGPLLKRPL
jgi:hypothetical protein